MNSFWQTLKKPIIGLAPMDGVTDFPTREIQCQIKKPDVLYTEFISVEGFLRNEQAFEKTLSFSSGQRPIVVQFFGSNPKSFYSAIKQVIKYKFNGIDLNFGCPAKKILKINGGGSLIGNYTLAGQIIKSSLKALYDSSSQTPLSIKTRIGKDKPITKEWISFLSGFAISEITIHGRLLKSIHSGPVNWQEIALAGKILKDKKIICLGNGGIKSLYEAGEKSKDFLIDGVLIGQASLGNPWVFMDNYYPLESEKINLMKKHAKLYLKFWQNDNLIPFRKHLLWYAKEFRNAKQLRRSLSQIKTISDLKNILSA